MADRRPVTLLDCERALGELAASWAGRCYEIASRIHEAGLVAGRVVYGHWRGPISRRCSAFAHAREIGFCQHGWIVTDEETGAVFDPTRWVFEAVAPYLFVGEPPDEITAPCRACDDTVDEHDRGARFFRPCHVCSCPDYEPPAPWPYDEGGNVLRALMERPLPRAERGAEKLALGLSAQTRKRLGVPARMTRDQVFWLANLSWQRLGEDVLAVYEAIERIGDGALIPFDNYERAKRTRRLTG